MADGEQKNESAGDGAPAGVAARPGTSPLVSILLAVNTVAVLAVVALQVLSLVRPAAPRHDARADDRAAATEHRDAPERKPDRKEGQPGPMLRLADFIVHLRDPDSDRYARVSFEMELPDEKAKEAVTARIPQIRDTFLAYLSDRTTEELRGSEAMGRVKGALAQKLADMVPSAHVRGLYVTELVVQ